jgi:SAM-dependent methyltransferase
MSAFAADWLALREPYDARARATGLERALAAWAAGRRRIEVLDLGSGTGANLRRLASALPARQRWRLIEHDPALIRIGTASLPEGVAAHYVRADLTRELEAVLAAPVDLVTASALLDLVSASWLDRLGALILARRTAMLVVLSWDGRIGLDPPHPDDALVQGLVARHQRSDKGFGPALGPDAARHLADRLAGTGGRLAIEQSDWQLGAGDRALLDALVAGWAAAASAVSPAAAPRVEAWRRARLAAPCVAARVGHQDLLWLPDGHLRRTHGGVRRVRRDVGSHRA